MVWQQEQKKDRNYLLTKKVESLVNKFFTFFIKYLLFKYIYCIIIYALGDADVVQW